MKKSQTLLAPLFPLLVQATLCWYAKDRWHEQHWWSRQWAHRVDQNWLQNWKFLHGNRRRQKRQSHTWRIHRCRHEWRRWNSQQVGFDAFEMNLKGFSLYGRSFALVPHIWAESRYLKVIKHLLLEINKVMGGQIQEIFKNLNFSGPSKFGV